MDIYIWWKTDLSADAVISVIWNRCVPVRLLQEIMGTEQLPRWFFLAFNNYDPKAKKVITKAAKNFARGLVSTNAILDTKVFIIGGSVFMNNIDILLPMVKYEFYRSFPALSNNVEFRPSALDKYLVDLGALSLVMPEEWIEEWQKKRPWEYAPEAIVLE